MRFRLRFAIVALVPLAASLTGIAVTAAPAHALGTNFEIVNRASGKCLDAVNSPSTGQTPALNGDKIQLWTCTGTANQMWHYGNSGELINNFALLCLDAANDQNHSPASNGDKIQLWKCNATANQAWSGAYLQPTYNNPITESTGDSYYWVLDAVNDPYVSGWTPSVNGDPVQMWAPTNAANQDWYYR